MTDINKLEELAKAAEAVLDAFRDVLEQQTDEAQINLDGAFARYETLANPSTVLDLISQYRRMEEALRPFAAAADDLSENHWDELDVWESPASGRLMVDTCEPPAKSYRTKTNDPRTSLQAPQGRPHPG